MNYHIQRPLAQGAKGRNGWFTPDEVVLWEIAHPDSERHHCVCLDVHSKRSGKEAPLILYLAAEDAVQVGRWLAERGQALLASQEAACRLPVA